MQHWQQDPEGNWRNSELSLNLTFVESVHDSATHPYKALLHDFSRNSSYPTVQVCAYSDLDECRRQAKAFLRRHDSDDPQAVSEAFSELRVKR